MKGTENLRIIYVYLHIHSLVQALTVHEEHYLLGYKAGAVR
jgi:hypothetical protein